MYEEISQVFPAVAACFAVVTAPVVTSATIAGCCAAISALFTL